MARSKHNPVAWVWENILLQPTSETLCPRASRGRAPARGANAATAEVQPNGEE